MACRAAPLMRERPNMPLTLLTAAALAVFVGCSSRQGAFSPLQCPGELHGDYPVLRRMLNRQVTVAEAERAQMVDGVPFGAMNSNWVHLRTSIAPGDQLWLFASCPLGAEAAKSGTCGMLGYALVRGCQVVDCVVVIIA